MCLRNVARAGCAGEVETVGAFGELLREIMPSWLSRPGKDPEGRKIARSSPGPRQKPDPGKPAEDQRVLSRQADAVWQECIDGDRHGEAFPEPVGRKRPAVLKRPAVSAKRKPGNAGRKRAEPSRKQ